MNLSWLKQATRLRTLIQWLFFLWTVGTGIRFALFVRHFTTDGKAPLVARPPGVEGFLPIGALVSLKQWLLTGVFDPIHPAALVLLLTFVAMSLAARKSFCSWLCPVGTLSEGIWKLGRKIFGRNFQVWSRLDLPLRGLKYLLLAFFIKLIVIDMPTESLGAFLQTPYWALSDVKMLYFFRNLSTFVVTVIGILVILSLFYQNFWCRYLCPYGALLGLFSMLSPLKIRRDKDLCIECGKCAKACPARLAVNQKAAIASAECTGCLSCTGACPAAALVLALPLRRDLFCEWRFPLLVVGLFTLGVGLGMLTGHWQTSLTYEDYQRLIPMAQMLGH